ncbi:cytochrome P450 [Streptomyces sp. NPDC050161]|uniref:cytochrome P450 n=1 Tax=Streptomyces sp. NPDC050161 TaxID=3365604 RepID=UPI0037AF7F6A
MSDTDGTTVETTDHALVPMHCLKLPEPGPPRRTTLPNGTPVWLITRYGDVRKVLTDARFTRSLLFAPDAPPLTDNLNLGNDPDSMFNKDGQEHLRVRRTIQRAFTPRAIERWRPWVTSVVDGLLDELVRRGAPTDLITGYTLPLPVAVISRLMGMEELRTEQLRHWSEHAFAGAGRDAQDVAVALREFSAFAAELLAERRSSPGDDLVSTLVLTADRNGGIPETQLVNLVCGLVVAGHETTLTVLGNAMLYLLGERPETWARIGSDEEAAGLLADRLLHLIPLGDYGDRPGSLLRTSEDVEVGGVRIRAGEVVAADRSAANRDPEVFPSAAHGSLFAPLEGPTLAFGAGQHYCPGTWLARLQLRLALNRLAARLPDLRLTLPLSAVEWRLGTTTRSPLSLPAAW